LQGLALTFHLVDRRRVARVDQYLLHRDGRDLEGLRGGWCLNLCKMSGDDLAL
jgi:hypothetical protein